MKNLKKVSLLLLLCFVVSVTAMSTVQAAAEAVSEKTKVTETTGVVIICPPDLVKMDFSKVIDTFIAENKDLKKNLKESKLSIGSKPQNKYIEFWQEKNLAPKTILNKEEMFEFAKYSKYDNLIIIMVAKPAFLLGSKTVNLYHDNPTLSLEVLAFLINKQSIIGSMQITCAAG